jgi:RNA recognition motif-containing protein
MAEFNAPRREKNLSACYKQEGELTTVMFRNVPVSYTQETLLEEVTDVMGTSETFDFFYLPWDLTHDRNVGYAFVNFCDSVEAEKCRLVFSNYAFRKPLHRDRPCKVCYAHVQGLLNNVRHLMDRAVSEAHSHYPLIIWEGKKLKLGKVIAVLDRQRRLMRMPMVGDGLAGAGAVAMVHLRQAIAMTTPEEDEPAGPAVKMFMDEHEPHTGELTTLMLRNIPPKYTQDMLLEEVVNYMGSMDTFDFFYLPWDLAHDRNVGYAFVNFRDGSLAEKCIHIFNSYSFQRLGGSVRPCKVGYARVQGLLNNVNHLMDRAVSEAYDHYPVIISDGRKMKLGDFVAELEGRKHRQLMRRTLESRELADSSLKEGVALPIGEVRRPGVGSSPGVDAASVPPPLPFGLLPHLRPGSELKLSQNSESQLSQLLDSLGSNHSSHASGLQSRDGGLASSCSNRGYVCGSTASTRSGLHSLSDLGSSQSSWLAGLESSYGSNRDLQALAAMSDSDLQALLASGLSSGDGSSGSNPGQKGSRRQPALDADDNYLRAMQGNTADLPVELRELCSVTENFWVNCEFGEPTQMLGRLRL